MEEKKWRPIDTYTAIRLSEYKGVWSLMSGNRGDTDTFDKWVCPSYWKNGEKRLLEKNGEYVYVPLQVLLGKGKEEALKTLSALYHELKGDLKP